MLGYGFVSIHAPREGCDVDKGKTMVELVTFQFTHPGRGATDSAALILYDDEVSIHAPREGCDTRHSPAWLGG